MKKNRVIAVVDCNNFFVSCERLVKPNLKKFPVIVLSGNDGCVVSRSNEAKKLNIPMGIPYFEIKNIAEKAGVKAISSHHNFYNKISKKIMTFLNNKFCNLDIYSIDEAFADMTSMKNINYINYCKSVRKDIYKYIGIPVSIGISKTRTLAKLAINKAKKNVKYEGVYYINNPVYNYDYFKSLEISKVWGIGPRLKKRLNEFNIKSIHDFITSDELFIKKKFGIPLLKTLYELKGFSCINTDSHEIPKGISRSTSFSNSIRTIDELKIKMAYFISEAAYNMRRKHVKAKLMTLFLARKNHGNDKEYIKYDFSDHRFITATNDTFNLVKVGEKLLCSLYRKNELYKKLGIIFSDLQKETALQYSIFDIFESDNKIKKVNNIIDNINDKYGYGTLRIGTCD